VYGSFSNDGTIRIRSDGTVVGSIDKTAQECFSKIAAESHVHLQLMLKNAHDSDKQTRQKTRIVALASVIIYGPDDLGEDLGTFLDSSGYFLQDPFGCDRDVPYKNPHCVSTLFEEPQFTSKLATPGFHHTTALSLSDSLCALQTTHDLPEWQQPHSIRTRLIK
jgi:hypothetical protein